MVKEENFDASRRADIVAEVPFSRSLNARLAIPPLSHSDSHFQIFYFQTRYILDHLYEIIKKIDRKTNNRQRFRAGEVWPRSNFDDEGGGRADDVGGGGKEGEGHGGRVHGERLERNASVTFKIENIGKNIPNNRLDELDGP